MDKQFTKMSVLVDDQFKIESVDPFVWKHWNPAQSKMEVSQEWQKDFKKVYPTVTDKGQLDLSAGQLAQLLEAASYKGESTVVGKTFKVKSNGQTGIEIRYFFDLVTERSSNTVSLDEIPGDW